MPDINTSPLQTLSKVKRRRGGQTGNQNARKHGFYSRTLAPAQASELFHMTNLESIDTEEAVFRLKLRSVLQHDPGNRRVIREGVLEQLDNPSPRNNKFLQNESICPAENKSGRRVRRNTFNKTNRTYYEN